MLGHRHHSTVSRWFSDSTSTYIRDHVPCSVLMGCNSITDEEFQAELKGDLAPWPEATVSAPS